MEQPIRCVIKMAHTSLEPNVEQNTSRRVSSQRRSQAQLQAYLLARETIRRHKPSATPCFARDWQPRKPTNQEDECMGAGIPGPGHDEVSPPPPSRSTST